ncbi:IS66 family transposase [Chromobacterium violaceum]|uniref:Transposase and inactivated derivatives n=2 Tax=Chromobacterium violaceum TaxID=536 RepID=A0AAX2M5T5_CHRVL|nr:Transposase and inactivated derivatives [Chromobacterium violaceum]STB70854.1 Transposase and inactivated derivatives [Chromobacterium violaceum]STB71637.1 Transposase and inactivated derivatives [Chromobacterium violaceum]SUX31378.1 Transposase and inactivated derivatives [Chromobacterium violaceum]SUX32986.1 Transposase and inactivated derivatives [Chromobacterium violaceum]
MDLLARLAQHVSDPTLVAGVQDMVRQLSEQSLQIQSLELKNQKLVLELAHLRRMRFGAKSEALTAEQRALFEDDADQDLAAVQVELDATAPAVGDATRKPRAGGGRQPLPEHLERIEVRHEPESCTCGQCQRELVKIGEDISEQLDVEPARFFVIRHIRPQYACRSCETVQAAPVAPAVIDGGLAAPGLLAWVAISKYLDHLPLYRIEQIAERQQVPLARSTLSEWIGRLGVALQPLSDRLADQLRERNSLHADETPVQQLDPGKGKTKRAYLWAFRSNDLDGGPPMVVFDYQTSRSGKHARDFLAEWRGHLIVDDYSGYKELFRQGVLEQACWAHARRNFFELQAAGNHPIAEEALQGIGRLYAVEAEGKELDIEQRQALRAERSLPELRAMHDWLLGLRPNVANGGGLAKAIDYVLRRWPSFAGYAETGHLPIDNNPVENAIRPIALGKKNWLFAGSERAGRRAAAIQSLLATAKLNGLEPAAWLKDTLERLPAWPNSRIDELLPLQESEAI